MSSDAYNYQRFGWDFESGADERWPTEAPAPIAGASSATEIILAGRQVSAGEALALRLVNRVVANSDVLSTAIELAETIVSKRTLSIEATMAAIGQQWHPDLQEGLAVELSQFGRVFSPDHFAPGLEAFLAGSPVDYTSE
jgi:enoyl-CoA hydratase